MSNYCDEKDWDKDRSPQLICPGSGRDKDKDKKKKEPCPKLPGTILRIFIPAGAVINLLKLIEISSPSGICIVVRIPLLGGKDSKDNTVLPLSVDNIKDFVEKLGATVEFVD